MTIYQIDIQKDFDGEFWTNVYYADAGSLTEAMSVAEVVTDAERSFHTSVVNFNARRVRTISVGDEQFINVPLQLPGLIVAQSVEILPLFNVVRVDLGVGTGRPSRKYYRGVLREIDVHDRFVVEQTVDRVQNAISDLLTGVVALGYSLVDRQGQQLFVPATFARVAMRQLRRGSRRRQTPVIPVS